MTYALITGASRGIGQAIAAELARRGFNVLLVARSEELLQKQSESLTTIYSIKSDYFATDLSLPPSPLAIYNWCLSKGYEVSILVNNAGYGLSGPLEKYTAEESLNMMQVNMMAPVYLVHLFLPLLQRHNRSYILNIASTSAYQAVPNMSVYSASKAFILNFSRGLRQELKGSTVSVTCISPGSTDTEFVVRANIGEKGLRAARKVNMHPGQVARIAVTAMLKDKGERIPGFVNRLGAFLAWLLPKGLVERTAMKLYE